MTSDIDAPVAEIERPTPSTPGRRAATTVGVPLLGFAIMAALGFWGLRYPTGLTNDEAATRWAGEVLGVPGLWRLVHHVDAVHAAYYLGVHAWGDVAGDGVLALRMPSVIGASVAAAMLVVLGRRTTGSSLVGLVAAVVFATDPTVDFYAQEARSYALVCAVVLLLSWVLVWALRAGTTRRWPAWLAYAVLTAVVGYLNELALAVLAAHAVTVTIQVVRTGRWRSGTAWLAAAAVGAAAVVPLVLVSAGQSGAVAWLRRPDGATAVVLWHALFGTSDAVAGLVTALALLGVATGTRMRVAGDVDVVSLALPLALVPPLVVVAVSLVAQPLFDVRYVIYAQAGVALLAGAGVVALARSITRLMTRPASATTVVALLGCVVLVAASLPAQKVLRDERLGYGSAAAYVARHSRDGDAVVFLNLFFRKVALAYPADFRRTADVTVARSPAATGTFRGTVVSSATARDRLISHRRVWTFGPQPFGRRPPLPALRASSVLLHRHYRLARELDYPAVTLRLWVRPAAVTPSRRSGTS